MAIILRRTLKTRSIDKYLMGTEIEVDAICDANIILGIMEHIERAGVHRDSIAVYPAWNLSDEMTRLLLSSKTSQSNRQRDL